MPVSFKEMMEANLSTAFVMSNHFYFHQLNLSIILREICSTNCPQETQSCKVLGDVWGYETKHTFLDGFLATEAMALCRIKVISLS